MTSFGSQKVQLSERGGVWPCETSLVQVFLACQTPWGGGVLLLKLKNRNTCKQVYFHRSYLTFKIYGSLQDQRINANFRCHYYKVLTAKVLHLCPLIGSSKGC